MTNYKARKTEYLGCVFRSKSEAMFAKYLDYICCIRNWVYEPGFLTVDDWCPDFAIPWTTQDHRGFYWWVIEYKPREPTETYLAELKDRVSRLRLRVKCDVEAFVCCVDWYNIKEIPGLTPDVPQIGFRLNGTQWERHYGLGSMGMPQLRDYAEIADIPKTRFDLVSS